MDETMDNQQRRMELDLQWLGAILDGEGCVTATSGHKKTSKGHDHAPRYTPLINIVNTDPKIIEECTRILKEAGIPFWIGSRKSIKNPTWKMKWEIHINGMKRCKHTIPILIPYCRSIKKERLAKLGEWIDYRLTQEQKNPYTDKDFEMLNSFRASPTTFRDFTLNPAN